MVDLSISMRFSHVFTCFHMFSHVFTVYLHLITLFFCMHSFVWSLDSKFAELDILWHSLRLLAGGIIISGPPCSLMVAASQSVHRRTWTNLMGNIQNKRVRLSNILWSNYAIWLRKASVTIHHIALRCNNSSLPILYNIMYVYIYIINYTSRSLLDAFVYCYLSIL